MAAGARSNPPGRQAYGDAPPRERAGGMRQGRDASPWRHPRAAKRQNGAISYVHMAAPSEAALSAHCAPVKQDTTDEERKVCHKNLR